MGPKESDRAAAEARRERALETPLDVRWRSDARFVHLDVRNPLHKSHYDVLFPAYPSREFGFCTCTDFAKRDLGTCKHLEAAWLWLKERGVGAEPLPEEPSERPVWEEIDRRLRAAPQLDRPLPLRIRYAGDALLLDRRRSGGTGARATEPPP